MWQSQTRRNRLNWVKRITPWESKKGRENNPDKCLIGTIANNERNKVIFKFNASFEPTGDIKQCKTIQTIIWFSKTAWKGINPAKPLFQVILATPNASDLIRQAVLIRSKDWTRSPGLLGENWATASREGDQKSRKDEKQMEIFSLLAQKCFPCCCGNLFSLRDTRSLLSLYLRIFLYWPLLITFIEKVIDYKS